MRGGLRIAATVGLVAALVAAASASTGLAAPAAARFEVTSPADLPDAQPGDGVCRAATGACTLRAAVMEANTRAGSTIAIPPGRFTLTIPPPLGPAFGDFFLLDPAVGNLKILAPTTVTGAGPDVTIIDGNHLDRVFSVIAPATLSGLTITGGRSGPTATPYNYYGGGGVVNASDLTMERVHVTANSSTFGGGIFNIPFSRFTLRDSLVDNNEAGEAGGIRIDWIGRIERSTITHNRVTNPRDPTRPGELAGLGGGIDVRIVQLDIIDSRIVDNYAEDGGAGINISLGYPPNPGNILAGTPGPGEVRMRNSTITGNRAAAGPSDCRAALARFVDLGDNHDSDGSCGVRR